jgi:hypothetical protein
MNFATSQPLFVLGFGSIIVGYILKDIFIGIGNPYFADFLYILPQHKELFVITELETSSNIKL